MLLADTVGHIPQLVVDLVFCLQLFARPHIHRIHNKVVVISAGVEVGGNKHLPVVPPKPPRRLHADAMAFLRRDLTGLKGLVGVVGHIAAGFAEAPLGGGHLLRRCFCAAVDTGDGVALLALVQCLGLVGGVDQRLLQIRQPSLLRVAAVVYHAGNAVMDCPDLRHRHRPQPPLRDRPAKAEPRFPSARR